MVTMSEKLLRFLLLTEIATVRLVCKNKDCGTIVELPIKKLQEDKWKKCSSCNTVFPVAHPDDQSVNYLADFSRAIEWLKLAKNILDIEFVLPGKEVCRLDRPA